MCTTGRELTETQLRAPTGANKTKRVARKNQEPQIDWQTWWPFTRATGTALRQLNGKQVKHNPLDGVPEALI